MGKKKHYNLSYVLNLEHLKEFFKYFKKVTNLRLTLLDEDGNLIIPSQGRCDYCWIIVKTLGKKRCRESDKSGFKKAAEIKAPWIYTCHAGLTDIVIPLFYEDTLVGAAVTGQVVIKNSPAPEYEKFFPTNDEKLLQQLKRAYNRVPRVNKKWLINVCNMLFHLLNYIIEVEMKNLIKIGMKKSIQDVRKELILRAKEYIDMNFRQVIDLKKLSAMYKISPFYFSKLFRQYTKLNFKEYLLKLRITEAKKRLAYSDSSIIEIAYEIGFQDSNYFSWVFKKIVGVTPTQYRKKYKVKTSSK